MKPTRVAQITLSMGYGGIENLIISLSRALKSAHFQIYIYCLDTGGELLEIAMKDGVTCRVFKRRPGLDWQLIRDLSQAFRQDAIQVMHSHNQAAHFYGCLGACLAGVPVKINTEHSRHYIDKHWRRRIEKRILSLLTDQMVAVSDELRQHALQVDRISQAKTTVITNGIDIDRFTAINTADVEYLRHSLAINISTKIISIIARLHPIKNHRLLFEAIKILEDFYEGDVIFLVVGDGGERSALQTLAQQLNIEHKIRFLGNRNDINIILKLSTGLVLCSFSEGLPLIILEAMAAKVPVLVTTGANCSQVVEHGHNGLVCDESPTALASLLQFVLCADDACTNLIKTAFRDVASRFSLVMTATRYAHIYRQFLDGKP